MNDSLIKRLRTAYEKRGVGGLVSKVFQATFRRLKNLWLNFYLNIKPKPTFNFRGRTLQYVYDSYNTTWDNERCLEVAICLDYLREFGRGKRVLEVGHVLNFYAPFEHDIIDKYEIAPGVLNEDVIDYKPSEKYDLIVSISTMEHVGWDEEPRAPEKLLKAFEHLKNECLAPGGLMVVTTPIGYNIALDGYWRSGELNFPARFMRRVTYSNWIETDKEDALKILFNKPYPFANAVTIIEYRK